MTSCSWVCMRKLLAGYNGSRTNKVGGILQQSLGQLSVGSHRLMSGFHWHSHFSVECRAAPHWFVLSFPHGPWTTLTRSEGKGVWGLRLDIPGDHLDHSTHGRRRLSRPGCLNLWGIPLRHIVSAGSFALFWFAVMHVTQSRLCYAHARTYECARQRSA